MNLLFVVLGHHLHAHIIEHIVKSMAKRLVKKAIFSAKKSVVDIICSIAVGVI